MMIEKKLGYTFKNITLLRKALTHPSSHSTRKASDFERLEFLGDRVLGLIVAGLLFERFPAEKEGDLAKRLAFLVSRDACTIVGQRLDLAHDLTVCGQDPHLNTSILADTVEAIIGAIFLDGGLDSAHHFVVAHWQSIEKTPAVDSKTALQEWAQQYKLGIPTYRTLSMEGPAHAPIFVIEVQVGSWVAQASGTNKRQAEQLAAKQILQQVNEKND